MTHPEAATSIHPLFPAFAAPPTDGEESITPRPATGRHCPAAFDSFES